MPYSKTVSLSPHSAQSHRFHLLDALRGVLALLVVLRHAPGYLTSAVPTKDIFLAVDFFFCLSGFVIAFAYDDRLRSTLPLQDFAVARLVRFYPTFLVGTLLAFAMALGPEHILSHPHGKAELVAALPSLMFLPAVPVGPQFLLFPLNMASWTLLLELVMNLGYALMVRGKDGGRVTLAILCAASWSVLAMTPRSLDSGSTWPGALVGLARMGFSFSAGVFLMHLWKKAPPHGWLRRTRGLPTAVMITVVLLGVILIPTPWSGQRAYQLGVISLALPALIFFGADIRLGKAGGKVCAALGELSYPLYIVHLPLLSPLFGSHVSHLAHGSSSLLRWLVPAYLVVLACFAWVLRMYFDAPLGRWLMRRYKGRGLSGNRTADALGGQPRMA